MQRSPIEYDRVGVRAKQPKENDTDRISLHARELTPDHGVPIRLAPWLLLWGLGCAASAPALAPDGTSSSAAEATRNRAESGSTSSASNEAGPAQTAADRSDEALARRPVAWLSPSHVGAAVRAHNGEFSACQTLAALESRREDGAVTVGWLVERDGSVDEVTLGPSTFASAKVNDCVLSVARAVTFPPSSAPTQVSWTVKFHGSLSGPLAAGGGWSGAP